jgi:multicomponent Na+:H+ antiporter subunit F
MTLMLIALTFSAFLCLFRIQQGPTIPDRTVGVDIMGILFVNITALVAVFYDLPYLMDLSIIMALFSFIGTLALAKYLEKRSLDD